MAVLANGYNIIINQKIGSENKPIYPITKFANVFDAEGNALSTKLFVPDTTGEVASSLRFLRNDNTWATIQNASTSQAGVVTLSSALDSTSEATAVTSKAAKDLKDALDILNGTVSDSGSVLKAIKDNAKDATYSVDQTIAQAIAAQVVSVAKKESADTGFAATYYVTQNGAQVGEAIEIPKDFLVKSAKLVHYVYDASTSKYYEIVADPEKKTPIDALPQGIEVGKDYMDFTINAKDASETEEHLYVDVTHLCEVYTGVAVENGVSVTINAKNEVAAAIAGKAIARANITDEFEADIAAVEATHATKADGTFKTVSEQVKEEAAAATYKTNEGSADTTIKGALDDIYEQIGAGGSVTEQIKKAVEELDATVDQAANDQGIAATVTEVDGKLTGVSVTQTAATTTKNGYMAAADKAKLDNCKEIVVSQEDPTFTTDGGIWFKIVSIDA